MAGISTVKSERHRKTDAADAGGFGAQISWKIAVRKQSLVSEPSLCKVAHLSAPACKGAEARHVESGEDAWRRVYPDTQEFPFHLSHRGRPQCNRANGGYCRG